MRPTSPRGRRCTRAALAIALLGAAFRIHLAATLPVGYDEVYVMGLGLESMRAGPAAALLDVPMTRSTAVAPLWWWVQYIPNGLLGEISLVGLRAIPVALGLLTMAIAWRCAARRFGRRAALVFLAFIALSDIVIFTNCRGEFAESLTLPLIVLLVCSAGRARGWLLRGLVGGLLLLTVLVKSILIVGLMTLAELAAAAPRRGARARTVARLALSIALAAAPALIYLGIASRHFAGQPIAHDALTAQNVPQLVEALVFDYAKVKAHVTGSMRDAAFVALDFAVWPVTALTAPLLIIALAGGARGALRAPRGRRAAAQRALVLWTLLGAAVVIGKGTLGARFHLMYLPAAWLLAGLYFTRRGALRRTGWFVAGAMAWAVWAGLAVSWIDWGEGQLNPGRWAGATVAAAALVLLAGWLARERGVATPALLAGGAVASASVVLLLAGPLAWADYARFEPMPRGPELAALDAARSQHAPLPPPIDRTLYIDLANYYLGGAPNTPENLARGLKFAELEAARVPDDPRAWAYVGEARLRNGQPFSAVRAAWLRSLELAPNERLAARLAQLEAQPPAGP